MYVQLEHNLSDMPDLYAQRLLRLGLMTFVNIDYSGDWDWRSRTLLCGVSSR